MLHAIAKADQRTVGVSIIWCQPRGRSKKGVCEAIDGMERMGTQRMIEMKPKRPSYPTATRGATE
jgi:hypothetical protein